MRFPIVCFDNFYENPDYIRKYALSLDYSQVGGTYPGLRSQCISTINSEFFQKSVIKVLSMYDEFNEPNITWSASSFFQKIWKFSNDPNDILNSGWIHQDDDTVLAAVFYLDTNTTLDSGKSIYQLIDKPIEETDHLLKVRSDVLGSFESSSIDSIKDYKKYLIENNKSFNKTLEVKNCYNRLIAYDGDQFHSQSSFYSENEDFRLTQVFFIQMLNSSIDKIPNERCESYGI